MYEQKCSMSEPETMNPVIEKVFDVLHAYHEFNAIYNIWIHSSIH